MFIYSVKASSIRFFTVLVLSIALLTTLIVLVPTYEPMSVSASETINFNKIKTNEDRVNFLTQLGWKVSEKPLEEVLVTIPDEFDAVFLEYNNLQKEVGLDLSRYKRKDVMRYTYELTGYPGYEGVVYANLLVYKNKVIGGDICSADVNGFVTSLKGEGEVQ
jgi:hypothetical protein